MDQLFAAIEAAGGFQSIYDAIADGALVKNLAAKFGVSRGWFGWVIRRDPERRKAWDEAMQSRADALAEDAIDIADNANENTPGGVQKAKLRAELRQWLASVDNGKYRRASQPQINVTINELHLDALRRRRVELHVTPHADVGPADTHVIDVEPLVALPPASEVIDG